MQLKQHAVIEFLTAENLPPINIHQGMKAVYGDDFVDVSTIQRWAKHLADADIRHAELHDEPCSRRPQNSCQLVPLLTLCATLQLWRD